MPTAIGADAQHPRAGRLRPAHRPRGLTAGSGAPAPVRQLLDAGGLRVAELAGVVAPAHLGDPAPQREALAVDLVLGHGRAAALLEVLAHVAEPGLVEEVDLDEAAVDLAQRDLVDVAPHPVLPGLEGLHHRVAGRLVVARRVLAGARVAAADVAAGQDPAQADRLEPLAPAVLAHRLGDPGPVVADVVDVLAGRGGGGAHGQDLSFGRRGRCAGRYAPGGTPPAAGGLRWTGELAPPDRRPAGRAPRPAGRERPPRGAASAAAAGAGRGRGRGPP